MRLPQKQYGTEKYKLNIIPSEWIFCLFPVNYLSHELQTEPFRIDLHTSYFNFNFLGSQLQNEWALQIDVFTPCSEITK
jgi:hypothetical protein